jgi:hypothetical protein
MVFMQKRAVLVLKPTPVGATVLGGACPATSVLEG